MTTSRLRRIWILLVISIWLYFGPSLYALAWAADRWWEVVAVAVFASVLLVFWAFGMYALVTSVAGAWGRVFVGGWAVGAADGAAARTGVADGGRAVIRGAGVRVALVYPTRNDGREEAVRALRRVRPLLGGECEVVLCDDSTLPEWRQWVERLAREEENEQESGTLGEVWNPVRVVRRPAGAPGWKAGNVNFALRQLDAEGFTHFAVCDADGVFPEDFVERTMMYFGGEAVDAEMAGAGDGARVAFVQTRQEGDGAASTRFSRQLAPAVGAHFRQQVAGRSAGEGFMMFYGHGAMMSMAAWREVGGFPEIVTEDLAFSMKVRAAGWRGVYADEVVCLEEFPLTWPQLRKRTDKWIRGTGECLKLHGRAFFRSTRVPWMEKLDVSMHGAQHFLAVPMLVFLGLLATILPWRMKEFRLPGSFFLPPVPEGKSLVEAAMGLRYHVFWSWDFYLVMAVTMLTPMLCFAIEGVARRAPSAIRWRALPGYFLASTFSYLAGVVTESLSAIAFLLTGKATFRVTNDADDDGSPSSRRERTVTARSPHGFHPNHGGVFAVEIIIGAGFLAAVWIHRNLWFLGPGLALVLSPLVAHRRIGGWDRWWVRGLAAAPGLGMVLLLILIGWQLLRWR